MEAQEILQDIGFFFLYGGVTFLDLAAALYLLMRRSNAIAPGVTSPVRLRRWGAAFLSVSALSHLYWMYYAQHPSITVYLIVCTLDILLIMPTITGILLSMLQDLHRPVWPMAAALVPAIVLSALGIIRGNETFLFWQSIYAVALYALYLLYMFFAVRRYGRWLRDNYADLENKEVWQSFMIMAVFVLYFSLYSITTEQSRVMLYLLQIDYIIILGLVLWRTETLQQLSESTAQEPELAEELQDAPAPTATFNWIDALLKKHCESGQLYLRNDLSLAQLANAIGTNRYYLSQYFARQGLTFNAYINGLRVDHFIRLHREAVAENRIVTALQLSSESGFRSYSTFSAAFKQKTGMTVTAWMQAREE